MFVLISMEDVTLTTKKLLPIIVVAIIIIMAVISIMQLSARLQYGRRNRVIYVEIR